ncbi:MAG: L,D-transpeptidase [Anaerolineales bacterium]|nr:L,D-transpeptidase [Anaerolineales bacterium]
MHNRIAAIMIGLGMGMIFASSAQAQEPDDVYVPAAINCPSRLQLRHPTACQVEPARAGLIENAVEGISPESPLPIGRFDETLGEIPFYYLRAGSNQGTPLYTSLGDAAAAQNAYRVMEPGFVFFSWIDWYDQDGERIYMVEPGIYIRGGDVSRIAVASFHGIMLTRTPDRPFAWVLNRVQPLLSPGGEESASNSWLNRYDMVQIYDMVEMNGWTWYMVGPDAWVEQRMLGIVFPESAAPEGVPENRWLSVNLYEQTLAAYEDGEMIFATLVSTGIGGWWTQPGVFQVYNKLESDFMQGAFEADRSDFYYLEDVPWILYYDQSRALHGAYWHNGFGYPRSHGCVNLSPADAEWIYDWSREGTWVYVFDPSGETPTDAELYGAGGF